MTPGPDFILIGAMKSATSTLHAQLAAQPGIFMSTPKEPCFFSDDDAWARGEAWYSGLFAGAASGDLRGESSTHYTKLPALPRTIERAAATLDPHVRFVYVMRHPIDRLVSHYIHTWTQREVGAPIDGAVAACPSLVDFGLYAMQLRPWLEQFGPERVLPMFFDAVTTAPQRELERLCRFIGYGRAPVWTRDESRANASSERLRASRWRDAVVGAPVLAALRRRLVPRSVRDRIKRLWTMNERPRLSEGVRADVERRFDEDLAVLGRWLGVELTCRTFAEATRDLDPAWTGAAPGVAAGAMRS